ncbi:hypothetical protein LLEC1_07717 [Akanthomyces lecanii]|uniref:RTA1 domain protein n=1 Tax=Cordyceps confragosa TaxID=2714763 RepID=A0A179I4Q4_CORDF|nr:hypothetical protein LLEC1_07717 [Akanthomyces lecanii]
MSQPTHSSVRRAGYVDPNFPNPNGPQDVSIIIYGFTPSFALAVFAAVFFFLYLVVHTAQTIRFKSFWFITFSVGLVFEVVGYCARALSAKKDPYHLIYFVLNYFFVVTAPVFLAAGIYTVLSTAEGLFGKLQTHEIYFACLEFAPVALAVLLLGCFHPGRCIKKGTTVEEDKLPHRAVSHV